MNKHIRRILFWAPRVLCMLFAVFLSLFALDVFSESHSSGEILLGLLIHLIPVYLVIIVLVVAWRWEWIGAALCILLAVFYLVETWGKEHWTAYVTISGSLALIGILFLFNWIYKSRLRTQ